MIAELEAIKRLLWEDWDPIEVNGFGPDDEYDSYASRIFAMVNEGKGEAEIAEYLRWAAMENMGLSDGGDCTAIAQRVIEIHERRL
jgi:peptide methionine sulfoxide reductase MsrA